MQNTTTSASFFTRRPLTALSKTAVIMLLLVTLLSSLMALIVKNPNLLLIAGFFLVSSLLTATGKRWLPLPGIVTSAVVLYIFLVKEPFPVFHLQHPKDALGGTAISFVSYVIILLILWGMVVALLTSAAAFILNLRQSSALTPRWFAAGLTGLIGVLLGATLIGAIVEPTAATANASAPTTTSPGNLPTVHLGISSFSQSTITLSKGSKLLLVDDASFVHILANGSWQNGQPRPEQQTGAPGLNNLQINGKSVEIGPFTTAGTYRIYCTVHPGMNLTINVV